MPRLATSSSKSRRPWSKLLWLAVLAWLSALCCNAQGDLLSHQVNVWYTWLGPGDEIATLAEQSTIQQVDTTDGEYEYTNVPELVPPSGMQLHLDVSTTHIRVEIRQAPTSTTAYTDRLYVAFLWPLLGADLLAPVSLPPEISFQALPLNTSVPFLDPGDFGLICGGSLQEGGLLVEFANISAASSLPDQLEFTYLLEIAPSGVPTMKPTFAPTFSQYPTLHPTTSMTPSMGPPSPSLSPVTSSASRLLAIFSVWVASSLAVLAWQI